jgi:putative membrane protein (TIGR04086 family)
MGVKMRAVLIGLVVSVVVSMLLLLGAEAVVPTLDRAAPESSMAIRVALATSVATLALLVGGYVAGRRAGQKGAFHGALVGALSFGVPALLALAFSPDEAASRLSNSLLGAAMQIGSGAIGGHLGAFARRRSEVARLLREGGASSGS